MSKGKARIRLFVIKELDYNDSPSFEVLKHSIFKDEMYSTSVPPKQERYDGRYAYTLKETETLESKTLTDEQWIQSNIDNIGFDGISESINEVLKSYAADDVVEILADYCIKGSWSHSYFDGDDYEEWEHLENIQHNKLRDTEITRFIGPFKRNKENLIVFEYDEHSLNHGIEALGDEDEKKA